jgi:hypothetical protein
MDLRFVSAANGNASQHQLLVAVAHEVRQRLAGSAFDEVHVERGALRGADGDVFVVVPDDYFDALSPRQLPTADQRRRTIGFCVEHAGTRSFERTIGLARTLGACVDVHADAADAHRAAGLVGERFRLGYTSLWDTWGGRDTERPCDALHLGPIGDHAASVLSVDPDALSDFDIRFETPNPALPHAELEGSSATNDLSLLATSKVLLAVRSDRSQWLDWPLVLRAICNGCVVVTEHSVDHAPLVLGEHFVSGSSHTMVHLTRALLEHHDRLDDVRRAAYDFIRSDLTMATSADLLLDLARQIDAQPPSSGSRSRLVGADAGTNHRRDPANPGHVEPVTADESRPASTGVEARRPWGQAVPDRDPESIDVIVLDDDVAAPGATANEALEASDAACILVLGPNDEIVSGAVDRLFDALTGSGADVAYGIVVTPTGTLRSTHRLDPHELADLSETAAAALWRRSTLHRLAGWDHTLSSTDEVTLDLWRRAVHVGAIAIQVPRPIVLQHRHQRATPP